MDSSKTQTPPEVGSSALLAAFIEHEKWIDAEIEAMRKNPTGYPECDRSGLPYVRDVLTLIRKQAANVESSYA